MDAFMVFESPIVSADIEEYPPGYYTAFFTHANGETTDSLFYNTRNLCYLKRLIVTHTNLDRRNINLPAEIVDIYDNIDLETAFPDE